MNQERAAELLPIIQAFAEGKKVSHRPQGVTPVEWRPDENPNFEDTGIRWRITPEPLVLLSKEALRYRNALEKIVSVNAMDYEYKAWAKEALDGVLEGESDV